MATHGVTETTGTELSQLVASAVHEQKEIVLANGAGDLSRGTVLAQVTATYKFTILNPGGAGGAEVARAILLEDADASAAEVKAQAFFIGKYRGSDLIWPDGITDSQKDAAKLQLQDRGILLDEHFDAATTTTSTSTSTTTTSTTTT